MSRRDFHSNVTICICLPLQSINTSHTVLLRSLAKTNQITFSQCDCKQVRPWDHFGVYSMQQQKQCWLGHIHLPMHEWHSVGAEHVHIQHSYRASPVFLWSCHGDCKLTCLFNNEAVFSLHFVNHPQGLPRWLKFEWALALHAFPSLTLSVCIVSLKIAIFLVKTHNCQRMSCVCIHNASSIVCFP